MFKSYLPVLLALTIASASCTRLAHHVAYGNASVPTTPSGVVREAVATKQAVDQYKAEKKAKDHESAESTYQAVQQRDQLQDDVRELQIVVKSLQAQIEPLKRVNVDISKENSQLSTLVQQQGQQIDALKAQNDNLTRSIGDLAQRIDRASATPTRTLVTSPQHTETVNLGSMTVDGETSVRRAQNGAVSVRSGNTHTTYTPRASQYYIRGPRGGCYYLTASGRKEYVSRSLCN